MSELSPDFVDARAARCVVLVEGASDRMAVEAVARLLGRDFARHEVAVVAMGGITNLRSSIGAFSESGVEIVGLLDEGELRFVRSVLERLARLEPDGDLTETGFHVCRRDLEDELLRAVGVETALGLVESSGDLPSYQIFCNQRAQRNRTDHDRLRRFAGTRSGRKSTYAGMLAGALTEDSIPAPLRRVVEASVDQRSPRQHGRGRDRLIDSRLAEEP